MSIKHTLALLTLVCLQASTNVVMADSSAGLNLSADGPNIHYQRNLVDYSETWAQPLGPHNQYISALVSQEASHRNLLISTALDLLKYGKVFSNNHSLTPKVYLFVADLFNTTTVASAAGASYRIPAKQYQWLSLDLLGEAFLAPQILTRGDIDYLWGINLQASYPLPQNNTFNIGYRKLQTSLEHRQRAIEQGIYIGLSSHF